MNVSAALVVEAKPERVVFEPDQTAVIVVDMQNDFGTSEGMFARAGVDISGIRAVIAPTARVLVGARRAGIRIAYLKMAFQPDLSDAGLPQSPNWLTHQRMNVGQSVIAPNGSPSRILIRDTWNTAIVDELAPQPGDLVMYKHRFSGFFGTDLDARLKDWGIRNLVFTGCTTSVCVESTLRDAMFRDYWCLLLEDCAAEPIGAGLPRTNHEATVLMIQTLLGSVSDSSAFVAAVERLPVRTSG